jgi:hypothetical protein
MFREPLRQAREAGVPTPQLAALVRVLETLEIRQNNEPTESATGLARQLQ